MKAMILADLHMCGKIDIADARRNIRMLMPGNLDVVIICGDILDGSNQCNPYKQLTRIFDNDVPVICVLGNHEFFGRTVKDTMAQYTDYYNPDKYDVHYLDVVGHYDMDVYRFFGNVLWYDGTMSMKPNQDIDTFADGKWADRLIHNFDWRKANADCVRQIMDNIGPDHMVNVLCTHCCPHGDLNLHLSDPMSDFNAYSGMMNLLDCIKPDYAFCGHTHRRIVGKYIGDCKCVNVGNDLYEFKSVILDI